MDSKNALTQKKAHEGRFRININLCAFVLQLPKGHPLTSPLRGTLFERTISALTRSVVFIRG
jgi:hypothetical protein